MHPQQHLTNRWNRSCLLFEIDLALSSPLPRHLIVCRLRDGSVTLTPGGSAALEAARRVRLADDLSGRSNGSRQAPSSANTNSTAGLLGSNPEPNGQLMPGGKGRSRFVTLGRRG